MIRRVIVTGGAGFIGSAVVRNLCNKGLDVLVMDCLTYAGNFENIGEVFYNKNCKFRNTDIREPWEVEKDINEFQPDAIMHLAAESHVDRSIDSPKEFIDTNIVGTFNLLEASRKYYNTLSDKKKKDFRFLYVSTDEVYGSLGIEGYFTEKSNYDPHSPYSASKASADHLVMAWYYTFGLPVVKTNCSNNYGEYQYPEKLIPLTIINCLEGKKLPIYGNGSNIRDWLYVNDHVDALCTVLTKGKLGETYNVGGHNERTNLQVVEKICEILDEIKPRTDGKSYKEQIEFVKDRPGHDARYAIDPTKIINELGWEPSETFETGLRKTVQWYIDNEFWWKRD